MEFWLVCPQSPLHSNIISSSVVDTVSTTSCMCLSYFAAATHITGWVSQMLSACCLQICWDSLAPWALDPPHIPCPPSSGCWSRSPRSPTGTSGHHGLASLPVSLSRSLEPLEGCVVSSFLPKTMTSTPDQSRLPVQLDSHLCFYLSSCYCGDRSFSSSCILLYARVWLFTW